MPWSTVHGPRSTAVVLVLAAVDSWGASRGQKASTCSKNILHVHSTMQRTPTVLLSVTSCAWTSFTILDHEDSIYPVECNSHNGKERRDTKKATTGFTYLINDTKLSYVNRMSAVCRTYAGRV